MSPGGRTQNRSLHYKRLERLADRVSRESQNARYFFADVRVVHASEVARPAREPH